MLFRYLHWRRRARRGSAPSAFSASIAAGYARFLSTLTTRGVGFSCAANTLRKNSLAASVSRFALSRKSIVWPVESTARYRYRSLAFDLYVGLVDTVTLARRLQMPAAALVYFGRIRL